MSLHELLDWQAESYARFHASRLNLLVHLGIVPLFWIGNIGFAISMLNLHLVGAFCGGALTLISMGLQAKTHALEAHAAIPFEGVKNALMRIFCEQWITFPRFVLSGGWMQAWRSAST